MYGYVNNRTGDFILFRTRDEAERHARDNSLTNFTIRPVLDLRSTRPGRPAGRTEDERCAESMNRFLAGGR